MAEIRGILSPCPAHLTDLASEGVRGEVPETGRTFEENAALKAAGYREMTGLAALADDSGLEVDALDGRPGVLSARYAGDGATDEANLRLLLSEMRGVPPGMRTARFRCAVAVALGGREIATFAGSVDGSIALAPAGDGGFGYDPVFVVEGPGSAARTMAQLPPAEKAAISHRGIAVRLAARWLRGAAGGQEAQYN